MFRYLKSALLLSILFLFMIPPLKAETAERPYDVETNAEILVFGDVHGAYDELVSLLVEYGIIDENLNWTGKDKHLVSLGDLIDRGPRSRDVLDLMIRLQAQAPDSGGEVHVLLGNHEQMVMTGDRRYTVKADYEAFSPDEKESGYEDLKKKYLNDHNNEADTNLEEKFSKLFPPGYLALDKAFSPQGYIGKWLLDQPLILKINGTVFVHGGIPAEITDKTLKEINREGKKELELYLETAEKLKKAGVLPAYVDFYDRVTYLNEKARKLIEADPDINRNPKKRPGWFDDLIYLSDAQQADIFTGKGPLWCRTTARCHIFSESYRIEKFLKHVNARRVVIGHTPTPNRKVTERMDGMVIMLDTGMLKNYYRGQASLLSIDDEGPHVHYSGESGTMSPANEERSLSIKLSGMSDAELEDFLLHGEITEIERIGTGITRPKKITLKKGNKTINAVFKTSDSHPGMQFKKRYYRRSNNDADRYVYDVAAYRIDRLLDLQMVPVAVLREIDGKEGVLQYWVENSINERDRLKEEIELDGYCSKNQQYWLRIVFDILIFNEDRNLTNILWSKDDFMLMFIDHSRAFRVDDGRPRQYRKAPLYVSDLFSRKLKGLNIDNLTRELSHYLHPDQISSILKRRDLILRERKSPD